MRLLFSAVFILLATFYSFSQIKYGISSGVNIHHRERTFDNKKIGLQVGVDGFMSLSKRAYLHAGLNLINLRSKYENYKVEFYGTNDPSYTINSSTNYLYTDVPFTFGYKVIANAKLEIGAEGGWFFSYGVGGRSKGSLTYDDDHIVAFSERAFKYDHTINTGPSAVISSTILEHYLIRMFGEWDITNSKDGHLKHQVYGLSIGYIF